MGATPYPEVLLFKRFQKHCVFIDTEKYEPEIADDEVESLVVYIKT